MMFSGIQDLFCNEVDFSYFKIHNLHVRLTASFITHNAILLPADNGASSNEPLLPL